MIFFQLYFGKTVHEVIADHITDYEFLASYGFPVGQESINWAIPCGRKATLSVDNQEVKLSF